MKIKNILIISALTLFTFGASAQNLQKMGVEPTNQYQKYDDVSLSDIKPAGWIEDILKSQESGLTGNLDKDCYPFNAGGWIGKLETKIRNGVVMPSVFPYEQTGYYYDGVVRAGLLLNSQFLLEKGRAQIYGSIEQAKKTNGVILAGLSGVQYSRWPHAIFLRAFMAEYDATKNPVVLDAMVRHFKNDTVRLRARDVVNIEEMIWLYRKTGEKWLLDKAIETYKNNSEDVGSNRDCNLEDLLASKKIEIHNVTFQEKVKLPALLYSATGNKEYLQAALNGFRQLEEFHLLADGVPSSEEALSGRMPHNTHETCAISDFSWATLYMLKITGDVRWADNIERATLNAGLSVVTKEFDAHQYAASCNQALATAGSSTLMAYRANRNAYNHMHSPQCCTGNVNRFFPIYAGAMWLRGQGNTLVKALFGPGTYSHRVDGQLVTISEQTQFPFDDSVILTVTDGSAEFPLHIRIPTWAQNPQISLNGTKLSGVKSGEFFVINRKFDKGDKIEILLPKVAEFKVWCENGMLVNYGPLLFALPVKAEIKKVEIEQYSKSFGYEMNPVSKWNYLFIVDAKDKLPMKVVRNEITNTANPWRQEQSPIEIIVPMAELKSWEFTYRYYNEGKVKKISAMTPYLPARGSMIVALRDSKIIPGRLVPYATSYLKMAILPYCKSTRIPIEALAADGKTY